MERRLQTPEERTASSARPEKHCPGALWLQAHLPYYPFTEAQKQMHYIITWQTVHTQYLLDRKPLQGKIKYNNTLLTGLM